MSSDVLFGNTGEIGPKPGTAKLARLQPCASAIRALSKPSGATAVAAAAPVKSLENSRRESDFIHGSPVVSGHSRSPASCGDGANTATLQRRLVTLVTLL